ncbi:MAG: UDP-3-O-(3-hydroxymyristoyl)glucosamine N-acyltransferase [Pseudomonadota bacterium]|nr:UDP-3-O-(3-hydroxymyristoyl)glucosamine N-acyltransferase [Pseudomonadota bacterium]
MQITLESIQRAVGGEIEGDTGFIVQGVNALDHAGEGEISYAESDRFLEKALESGAGALVVTPDFPSVKGKALLRCDVPRATFVRIMLLFRDTQREPAGPRPGAVVAPGASIGDNVAVGENAVVGDGARVGDGTGIAPGATIGKRVTIGRDCHIGPNVVLYDGVTLGDRVRIHGGAVIGGEGFGNVRTEEGWIRIPQLGTVVIEDDVDIGCNTCVDRAAFGETRIRRGTKIDNLVQVAHNSDVGEDCLIVSQAGLAGSVTLGKNVTIAGQVAVVEHIKVGDGAIIAGQAGVTRDVGPGEITWGTPNRAFKRVTRELAALARLPGLLKDIKAIERRLRKLETSTPEP